MADLVSGRYPQQNQNWSLFGQANNVAQSDVPAFTTTAATELVPTAVVGVLPAVLVQ